MALRLLVLYAVLSLRFTGAASGEISVGIIRNASLKIVQGNPSIIHGTCETCRCALFLDPSLFAFNCFSIAQTCEMFSKTDQGKPYAMVASNASTCYLSALPSYNEETSTPSDIGPETTSSIGELCSRFTSQCVAREG